MKTPVVLFNGFLDAGKTTLLREALEDDMWRGDSALILLCEEGEEEVSCRRGSHVVSLDSAEQLQQGILSQLDAQFHPEVVFLEYNGMWLTNDLTTHLPPNWELSQSYMTADAQTFLSYTMNMRALMVDKLDTSQFILFNRCPMDLDIQKFHDIVRKVNLKAQVSFEYTDGSVVFDELPIQIPYDLAAPVVEIRDEHFALFYRDYTQDLPRYLGKTLRLKGQVRDYQPDGFVFGRMVMICCEQDMTYAPLSCCSTQRPPEGQWVTVTAQVQTQYSALFQKETPCLMVTALEAAVPPEVEIATYQ